MFFNSISEEKLVPIEGLDGVDGIKIQWLLPPECGMPNFEMRYFEIKKGGYCRKEQHPWEHVVLIVKGKGIVVTESGEKLVKPGDAILVEPNDLHQFKSTDEDDFGFICSVMNGAEDHVLNQFKPDKLF